MQVKTRTSLIFECDRVRAESLVDALAFFTERIKKLNLEVNAIFPGEPYSLPAAMLLSNWLSVPIKTESFISRRERVLVLFFSVPFKGVTQRFVREKLLLFREKFPNSPSLLLVSEEAHSCLTDFQLIKGAPERLFSLRFLKEARKNFFWPVKGEVTHVTDQLWELAKLEAKNFLRAKRIRDSARRYLKEEEVTELKLVESELELSLWERFKKGVLTSPEVKEEKEEISLKVEKLFQVEDKLLASAITSLLEFLAQSLEYQLPTGVAYSNYEVVDREGVLIIPKVKEELNGVDLVVEFVLKARNGEKEFELLFETVRRAVKEVEREILKESFKPHFDWSSERELGKFHLYLSWFLDREMAKKLYGRINREWLVSRLLARKRSKSELLGLLKLLREFKFSLESYFTLKSKLTSLWKRNENLLKVKGKELKEALTRKNLWPLIAFTCASGKLPEELCRYLSKLYGADDPHQILAESSTYWAPVSTKRSLRGEWERVIKGKVGFSLKPEPLNPSSPVTYVLQTEEGKTLGEIPKVISHYLFAKERSGKKLRCRELWFEPDMFSENSYWVEIECL